MWGPHKRLQCIAVQVWGGSFKFAEQTLSSQLRLHQVWEHDLPEHDIVSEIGKTKGTCQVAPPRRLPNLSRCANMDIRKFTQHLARPCCELCWNMHWNCSAYKKFWSMIMAQPLHKTRKSFMGQYRLDWSHCFLAFYALQHYLSSAFKSSDFFTLSKCSPVLTIALKCSRCWAVCMTHTSTSPHQRWCHDRQSMQAFM